MVWCWQQDPDDRPKADQIIVAANDEQFLRLFDGIRASNGVQVGVVLYQSFSNPLPTIAVYYRIVRIISPWAISLTSALNRPGGCMGL